MMKLLIIAFMVLITSCTFVNAQTDTLVIKLKNNQSDKIAVSQIKKITFENVSGVQEHNKQTSTLIINGNNPNPFQEKTDIEFEITTLGNVEIYIFDNNGNQIQVLECINCQIGKNTVVWNCLDKNNNRVQSGIYVYEVRFNNEIKSKKMLMVK
ncbi:MAG: T9SS type A sorting domain-containing protein [bacterium]